MPTYVYGCQDLTHDKVEVVHGFSDNPNIFCSTCHKKLHRVPQKFDWGWHPSIGLIEHFDRRYTEWRTREQKKEQRK
jgi:hypothetical protein